MGGAGAKETATLAFVHTLTEACLLQTIRLWKQPGLSWACQRLLLLVKTLFTNSRYKLPSMLNSWLFTAIHNHSIKPSSSWKLAEESLLLLYWVARFLLALALHAPRAYKNGRLEERVTPTEARSQVKLLNSTKNKTPGLCFATMATSTHSYAVRVTIFSMVQ